MNDVIPQVINYTIATTLQQEISENIEIERNALVTNGSPQKIGGLTLR
jgi:hypothetical protein